LICSHSSFEESSSDDHLLPHGSLLKAIDYRHPFLAGKRESSFFFLLGPNPTLLVGTCEQSFLLEKKRGIV